MNQNTNKLITKPNILSGFKDVFKGGGLSQSEKEFLASIYKNSNSVFEWGMGTSTLIAAFINIQRLVAIDSSNEWVNNVKKIIPHKRYQLKHIDIGKVKDFGYPVSNSTISTWPTYSSVVKNEQQPFDVYLIDGRFRVACICMALMHADENSYILVHDFDRKNYHVVLTVAEQVKLVNKLVVLKIKTPFPKQEIETLYEKYKHVQE